MLRKMIAASCLALLLGWFSPAMAQSNNILIVASCGNQTFTATLNNLGILTEDTTGKLCVNATVSASITGFPTIQSTGTPISVTTGGVTGTLPTGAVVVASNVGATNGAYCKLGASATTSDQPIPPNSWFAFTVGANTQLTCITSTSTTTVNMVGGSGLPTGSGGGGGGSGGGGAITAASGSYASGALSSGSMVDLGSQADAACGTDNGSCSTIALIKRGNQNATTLSTSPVVAGTARIGYVSDDPCSNASIKAFLPITLLTASVKVIAPGVAAKKITICHIDLNNSAADSIAIFESTTGTTCATAAVAVYGAGTSVATAGNGYNFSANGGISLGNGRGTVGQTTVNNNDLCVAQSAATPLTGGITYAVQ